MDMGERGSNSEGARAAGGMFPPSGLERIGAEFPGWYAWRGVTGLVYARLVRSSPPIVIRAHNLGVLRARVAKREEERRARRGQT